MIALIVLKFQERRIFPYGDWTATTVNIWSMMSWSMVRRFNLVWEFEAKGHGLACLMKQGASDSFGLKMRGS
jgi:hypothetical protein